MNVNTSSVQEVLRGGEKIDLYYYNSANLFTQERPTLSNTKFTQQINSLSGGVSQFIFSPYQGLSDVFLTLKLHKQDGLHDYTDYGLSRGWGYAMINQISVRYGGSSQYYFSGQQMMMQNVLDMQDAPTRDKLFSLGGQACLPADFVNNQYAYCYLNLPHNSPNGVVKALPFPSELLRQPILITVELKNPASVFSVAPGQGASLPPFDPLEEGYFQVRQVNMINSADLMTAHADPMNLNYVLPLKYFPNQEFTIQLPGGNLSNPAQISLTGFRNGQVKSIVMWLTSSADTPPVTANGALYNPFSWAAPANVTLSINGEIFYFSKYGSSLLIDLVNNVKANELATAPLAIQTGALVAGSPYTSEFIKVDFSQHCDVDSENSVLIAGKTITNSIVNVSFTTPDDTVGYTLHALYIYNSSLVFSNGNCDYSF